MIGECSTTELHLQPTIVYGEPAPRLPQGMKGIHGVNTLRLFYLREVDKNIPYTLLIVSFFILHASMFFLCSFCALSNPIFTLDASLLILSCTMVSF